MIATKNAAIGGSCAHIPDRAGFYQAEHVPRLFHRLTGRTPAQYRKTALP